MALFLRVKFTRIGADIKYELPVRLFCKRMNKEMRRSGICSHDSELIKTWLGNNPKRLFEKHKTIYRKVNIRQIYDNCDVPIGWAVSGTQSKNS